jgi:hypothetical protein
MTDQIKKYMQHQQMPYLDNIALVHQKHSELLTDHMQRSTPHQHFKKIDESMDVLYANKPLLTDMFPPIQKPQVTSKEKDQPKKESKENLF